MSLIQEALRRQREEQATQEKDNVRPGLVAPASAAPASATAPGTRAGGEEGTRQTPRMTLKASGESPPPARSEPVTPPPPPPIVLQREAVHRPWVTLAGLVIALLVLLAGGIWLGWLGWTKRERWFKRTTLSQASSAYRLMRGGEVSTDHPGAPPVQVSLQTSEPSREPLEEAASPPPAPSRETRPSDLTANLPTPRAGEEETAPAPLLPARAEPQVPKPAPVVWPSLTLSGVVGKGTRGSAIINKTVVAAGETLPPYGVRVVSIEKQGVVLEYQGQQQFLKVGGSTR